MKPCQQIKLKNLVNHPIVKRITITIPLAVCFGFIWIWAGFDNLPIMGFMFGLSAYFISSGLLLGADEMKASIVRLFSSVRDNYTTVVKHIVCVSIIVFAIGNYESPADPLLSQIQKAVETFGLLFVLLYQGFSWLSFGLVNRDYSSGIYRIGRVVYATMVYSVVLWLLGAFGDSVREWIVSNPNEAIVAGVSIILIWLINKISTGKHESGKGIERGFATGSAERIGDLPRLTKRDSRYIAAHESGHAMVYAALGSLPPGLELVIKDDGNFNGSLGYVSGINSDHCLNERKFCEWLMLVLLAGKKGESFAFTENTMGSVNDHKRWLDLATNYLSNHFSGIYYNDPQNKYEQELNEDKLENLQKQQIDLLDTLFLHNADLFHKLSGALLQRKRMSRDDLIPYLSQVALPAEFPLPLGSFEEFGGDWPNDIGLTASSG